MKRLVISEILKKSRGYVNTVTDITEKLRRGVPWSVVAEEVRKRLPKKQASYLIKKGRQGMASVRRAQTLLNKVSQGLQYASVGVELLELFGYGMEGESITTEDQCRAMSKGMSLLGKVPIVDKIPGLGAMLEVYKETFDALGEFCEELEFASNGTGEKILIRFIERGKLPPENVPFGVQYSTTWRKYFGIK